MRKKWVLRFIESKEAIGKPVTKFGGQPVWIAGPAWPLSRETGKPMQFIGQVALNHEFGFTTPARMAYLFMTGDDDGFVDGTYDPDGGENAVILQPGTTTLPTSAVSDGPSLYRMVHQPGNDRLQPKPCEFSVELVEAEDVDFVQEENRWKMSEEEAASETGKLNENKVGGTPVFMQGDEFPFDDGWQFLLQLDSCNLPFEINFGDAGVGYAFLNSDGSKAKFLWQCG